MDWVADVNFGDQILEVCLYNYLNALVRDDILYIRKYRLLANIANIYRTRKFLG